jgi:hypothetical protein
MPNAPLNLPWTLRLNSEPLFVCTERTTGNTQKYHCLVCAFMWFLHPIDLVNDILPAKISLQNLHVCTALPTVCNSATPLQNFLEDIQISITPYF